MPERSSAVSKEMTAWLHYLHVHMFLAILDTFSERETKRHLFWGLVV